MIAYTFCNTILPIPLLAAIAGDHLAEIVLLMTGRAFSRN